MTLKQLLETGTFRLLTEKADLTKEVTGGVCCDLLSWVMAKGQQGMAWVTVQTHMNVVAVAALHEFTCIILAEDCAMPVDVIQKASDEGIAVISSALSEYTISGLLYGLGIGK
jgi:hypothetical protein